MREVDPRVHKLADRVQEVHQLLPPIDIEGLLEKYAEVRILRFPYDLDGLCLDLKKPGVRPSIFIKRIPNVKRMRFTMAHELGHVVIPWHVGNIADNIDADQNVDLGFWHMEQEANAFAADLLIPREFVRSALESGESLEFVVDQITEDCIVSLLAAMYSLIHLMDRNNVIIFEDCAGQRRTLRSPATNLRIECAHTAIDDIGDDFPSGIARRFDKGGYRFCHLWFPRRIEGPEVFDDENWRDLMAEAMDELGFEEEASRHLRSRVSAITAFINGGRQGYGDVEEMYAQAVHRLETDDELRDLLRSYAFHRYLKSRFVALTKNRH